MSAAGPAQARGASTAEGGYHLKFEISPKRKGGSFRFSGVRAPPGSAPGSPELTRTQRILGGDTDLHDLVQVHRHHFAHARFDHLGREEVGLSLLLHGDLPVVLLESGTGILLGLRFTNVSSTGLRTGRGQIWSWGPTLVAPPNSK